MSAASSEAEAEAVAFGDPDPGPMPAGARRRAFSVTTNPSLPAVTPRVSRAGGWLSEVAGGGHLTGQLPSLHAARLLVHEDAAPFAGTALGPLRIIYGYLTWPVIAVLYLAAWVLHRPSRVAVVAVVLGPAAWYFLSR